MTARHTHNRARPISHMWNVNTKSSEWQLGSLNFMIYYDFVCAYGLWVASVAAAVIFAVIRYIFAPQWSFRNDNTKLMLYIFNVIWKTRILWNTYFYCSLTTFKMFAWKKDKQAGVNLANITAINEVEMCELGNKFMKYLFLTVFQRRLQSNCASCYCSQSYEYMWKMIRCFSPSAILFNHFHDGAITKRK